MEIQRPMVHAGRRALMAVMAAMVTLAAALTMTAAPASATGTATWIGGGANTYWTTPGNWEGGVAPSPGDNLLFKGGVPISTNNFPAGTAFASIRFVGGATTMTLRGNQVALGSGGISADDSFDPDNITVALPIRLALNQTFTIGNALTNASQITYSGAIDLNGRTLTFAATPGARGPQRLTGALSGAGSIIVAGGDPVYCSVVFAGTNTSTGRTTVNQGCETFVNGDYSTRTTIVGANGRLAGRGTLGATTALTGYSAVDVRSDTSPTSSLTVNGPLSLRAGSDIYMTINGTTPGTTYSQVVAKNTVALGTYLVLLGDLHPAFGQTFTILSNQGGTAISGTFQGLPEGGIVTSNSGAKYRITYKGGGLGRDVVLTAVTTANPRVWTGGGTNNLWTQPANWAGGVAPKPGDDLYFPFGAARLANVNNFPAGTAFGSIYFPGTNPDYNLTYAISGNRIVLNGGAISVGYNGEGDNIVLSLPLTLGADAGFATGEYASLNVAGALDLAGHSLYLGGTSHSVQIMSGVLTGAGRISSFASSVQLKGSSPDAGTIEVGAGSLSVVGDYHLRSVKVDGLDLPVVSGQGAVGPVTVGSGKIDVGATVNVTGKLSMAPGSIYRPEFNGPGAEDHGELVVTGPVVPGGATLVPASSFYAGPPPDGTVLTIVSNRGGAAVSGTFAGLPEGSLVQDDNDSSVRYRISYTGGASGRDITLTLSSNSLLPETDLAVTQTASPDPVAKGDKVSFDVTVTNNGPEPTKVNLRDRMPDGTTLVSLSQLAGWSCRTGTGAIDQGIRCTSDEDLAAGSSQTFTLVVRVGADAGPTISNKATVSGSLSDYNTTNNMSVATVGVAPAA